MRHTHPSYAHVHIHRSSQNQSASTPDSTTPLDAIAGSGRRMVPRPRLEDPRDDGALLEGGGRWPQPISIVAPSTHISYGA